MNTNLQDPLSSNSEGYTDFIRKNLWQKAKGFIGLSGRIIQKLLKISGQNLVHVGIAAVILFVSVSNFSGADTSSFLINNNRVGELETFSKEIAGEGWGMANAAFVFNGVAGLGQVADENQKEDYLLLSSKPLLINEMAVMSYSSPVSDITPYALRNEIFVYTVQSGDVPGKIADKFGISTNTLLWANNLTAYALIRPGDKLKILPVTGISHAVAKGDTIASIAKKYKADESKIISFNDLPADGSIVNGQLLVVPDGEKPAPVVVRTNYASAASQVSGIAKSGNLGSHTFPWGQCTWYVAQKRYVPWSGHAKSWLYNAKAYGFTTGLTPQVGAIMATSESWYGHVAYVESINGEWVTISEMNHPWGSRKVTWRTLNINSASIKGYIY